MVEKLNPTTLQTETPEQDVWDELNEISKK
jgi:hypothetical protein